MFEDMLDLIKYYIVLFFLLLLPVFNSQAQNEVDALRYSFTNSYGTARFMGVGGSMGAIGADLGAVQINPAAMGKFNRGEFSFTPNITFTHESSLYNNTNASDGRLNLNLSNIGFVVATPVRDGSLWRTVQIGFNYTRNNDFQSNEKVSGEHTNSLLDEFAALATGLDPNTIIDDAPFDAGLAYYTYVIEYDQNNNEFFPWYNGNRIKQTQALNRRGGQYSSDITLSGNYADKILIGGSIGFPSIRYRENRIFTEEFIDNAGIGGDTLNSYTYRTNLKTTGSGFNAKIGVVIMPVRSVRLGLAAHSPSWYSMEDSYNSSINSNFANGDTYEELSPDGIYEYRLRTPAKYIGSFAYVLGKRGFVSAEYELVDYTSAKLGAEDYSFSFENEAVRTNYTYAGNLRLGFEFRATNHLTARVGFANYGSPYNKEVSSLDGSRKNYSGGLGYRDRNFSIDFTYVMSKWKNEYYLYAPTLTNSVVRSYTLNNFMITAGFRF